MSVEMRDTRKCKSGKKKWGFGVRKWGGENERGKKRVKSGDENG